MRTTRRSWSAALLVMSLGVAPLAGCGADTQNRHTSSGFAVGAQTAWTEPDHYAYTLLSTCGERNGLGVFRLWVHDGRVERAKALREWSDLSPLREMPTIGDLVRFAAEAQDDGADEVRVTRAPDGRPRWVSVDYMTNAIDDEVCYRVSDLTDLVR